MSKVKFKSEPVTLAGKFPKVGDKIADFSVTKNNLTDVKLSDFRSNLILLSIFPSIDTSTCSESVIHFNQDASSFINTKVLCISNDLPFAQQRFCGAHNILNVHTLSAFRSENFGKDLGIAVVDSPLRGLLARAVIVINSNFEVVYTELVDEITHAPNYEKCISFMAKQFST